MPYCPKCGKQVKKGKLYCPRCIRKYKRNSLAEGGLATSSTETQGLRIEEPSIKEAEGIAQEPLIIEGESSKKKESWYQRNVALVVLLTGLATFAIFPISIIIMWPVCDWALKLRNRSPLCLLLVFCNLPGWLIIAVLLRSENRFLTKEQIKAGLYLEKDRGFLNLMKGGEFLTTFPIQGTTKKAIREKAQEYV